MFERLYFKLEWLFFKKELLDRILELRAEGNLREKAYQKFQAKIIFNLKLSTAFLLMGFVLMVSAGFPFVMILPIIAIFIALIINSQRGIHGGKPVYFYTMGSPEVAHVTKFSLRIIAATADYYNLFYSIETNGKDQIIEDKVLGVYLAQKNFQEHPYLDSNKEDYFRFFRKGDRILVFTIPTSISIGMVYYPAHFEAYCLDKKKFKEIHEFIDKQEGLVNI